MKMKKTVLKFGLISGAIMAALMFATVPFIYSIGFDYGTYIGYTSMLIAFILVFFGVRAYRDNVMDGHIGFFRAWGVAWLIALISTLCYVAAWEVVYFTLLPDFPEKYSAYMVETMTKSGDSPEAISAKVEEIKYFKTFLDNPLWNGLIAFFEPFPVSLLVTFVSALVLRKKRPVDLQEQPVPAT
jgi:hypothetical protein